MGATVIKEGQVHEIIKVAQGIVREVIDTEILRALMAR
jgi:hypothetical protein